MVVDDVMWYKIRGMWPPACGTTGFAMVRRMMTSFSILIMNVLERYMKVKVTDENLGLHRLIEVMKHMLAARMDLGDPAFVDGIANVVDNLLSKSYAETIQNKISDNTTFPPENYLNTYNQLEDQGTTHFCVVDKDRNAVSMTTTVNYAFGSGFMSPSTGIILNGQMEDFAVPTLVSSYSLPPAPTNYISPKKRALSSMMPLIITKKIHSFVLSQSIQNQDKGQPNQRILGRGGRSGIRSGSGRDNDLVGVIGASGGPYIFPAVIQVFLNHFIFKMSPLEAVQRPRVYPKDMTVYNGDHIKLTEETREFLKARGHELVVTSVGGINLHPEPEARAIIVGENQPENNLRT
ncbi:hypothetical protein YC2023_087729 [Brassica napus]